MDMKTQALEVEEAAPKQTFSSARVALIGLAVGVLAGLVRRAGLGHQAGLRRHG